MGQEQPKGPKNAPTIWVFDKNLIDLYGLFFLLEHESTNNLTFCKNRIVLEKFGTRVMVQKAIKQSETAISHKRVEVR